jgi:hypothetical protein
MDQMWRVCAEGTDHPTTTRPPRHHPPARRRRTPSFVFVAIYSDAPTPIHYHHHNTMRTIAPPPRLNINPGPYCTGELDDENEGRESPRGRADGSQVLPARRRPRAHLRVLRAPAVVGERASERASERGGEGRGSL